MDDDLSWVVLRCRPSETLTIVQWLEAVGKRAWSPTMTLRMRLPRSRVVGDVVKPMLPSFLFAERAALGVDQSSEAAKFRPMIVNGALVVLDQANLQPLMDSERKAIERKPVKRRFSIGERVAINFGPFAGHSGIVVGVNSNYVRLEFENTSWDSKNIAFAIKSLQA
jgi:hypothetical protein